MAWNSASSLLKVAVATATPIVARITTVEWPSEKNSPVRGRGRARYDVCAARVRSFAGFVVPIAKAVGKGQGQAPHRHVWTAPSRQGFSGVSADASGCGHVCGL